MDGVSQRISAVEEFGVVEEKWIATAERSIKLAVRS